MKYLSIFLLVLLFINRPIFSQEYSREFGKLSNRDVDLNVYEKDPEAEAVVLFDIGESVFVDTPENGYDIQFTRTKRIKILSQSGVKHAEIKLPFYGDGYGKRERYGTIEAFSYNIANGRIVKTPLDVSKIYEEIISDQWKAKTFVIPNVKEGTIIEYKSVLITPFKFNPPDWVFQDMIPTIHSQYTIKMIPFYEYVFIVQGVSKFSYQNSEVEKGLPRRFAGIDFHNYAHTYVLKNIPAFKDEAYMTSVKDYLIKMDFQLSRINRPTGGSQDIITTWEELNKSLLKHSDFGKYIKKSTKIAEQILEEELILTDLDQASQVKAIVNYVKTAFSWDGYSSKYASKTPKELVDQKTGNAADINLFLLALLETAGINAQPVILSTRNHGKLSADYPFSHFFNYVVPKITIGQKAFLCDGTDPNVAYRSIPSRCINEKGLIVSDDVIEWINLFTEIKSVNYKNIELIIDQESLSAKTSISSHYTEFESSNYKKKFNNDTVKMKNHLLDNGFETLTKIKTVNAKNPAAPYIVAYKGEIKIESIDDKLLISPFLNFPIQENYLTQKSRSTPVDFIYPKCNSFKSTVRLPKDCKVLNLPEPFEMKNALADIVLNYEVKDGVVTATGEYYFKKSVYQAHEYERVKSYINAIVKKFNTQLVLISIDHI